MATSPFFLPTYSLRSSSHSPLLSPFCRAESLHLRRVHHSLAVVSVPALSSRLSSCPHLVSIAHIDAALLPVEFDLFGEILRLRALRSRINGAGVLSKKLRVLDDDSKVREFLHERGGGFFNEVDSLGEREEFLVKCVVAAGQGHVLNVDLGLSRDLEERSSLKSALSALGDVVEKLSLNGNGAGDGHGRRIRSESLKMFLKILDEMERFYDGIGGIIGYQLTVLELLSQSRLGRQNMNGDPYTYDDPREGHIVEFFVPRGFDLLRDTEYASQAALWGIEGLPLLGEIYPIGGASDRLGLVDLDTGECLPAAMLPYCGRTLFEGLVRDLQAREFLYFKIFGKQCITPVAVMTSSVKDNHEHITKLCESTAWFGRGQHSFCFFEQPLVPVVSTEDGQWLIRGPFSPLCRPGGHGAIWKLAHDKGVFDWFSRYGRKGAIVRQVSNVVAATDVTLLALAGIGLQNQKKFGFASCERISGATEGINVLVEKSTRGGPCEYGITCIEYTEFERFGIREHPLSGSLQAEFPANANILYVDLQSAEEVGSSRSARCLPGLVLNLKKTISYVDHLGVQHCVFGGRLECSMQNVADNFFNRYESKCDKNIEEKLDTFIVHNERKRVTSSAKRKRKKTDKSLHQTPDGSLLDIIQNASDLLSACSISIPQVEDNSQYLHSEPPFIILLNPALGPLWEVTRQKFFGGSISKGSELQVEVAEFLWRNVELDGSLVITAENIMGSVPKVENGDELLHYGLRCARCKLEGVKVLNKGVDWKCPENIYWMHRVRRIETLRIILHGNAEFETKDVTFQGNYLFEVPDGHRMSITQDHTGGFSVEVTPIEEKMMDTGTWFWKYSLKGTHVHLDMGQADPSAGTGSG